MPNLPATRRTSSSAVWADAAELEVQNVKAEGYRDARGPGTEGAMAFDDVPPELFVAFLREGSRQEFRRAFRR